jgi:microcystin-dependent protein
MPSQITSSQFANQTPGQALCDSFQEKLLNNSKMRALLDYFFLDPTGQLNTGFIGDLLTFLNPIGTCIWVPKTLLDPSPADGAQWLEANNQRLQQADYARLFALYGTTYNQVGDNAGAEFRLPDLQGKFLLPRSGSHGFGTTGGEETHVLAPTEAPAHVHHIANTDTADAGGGPTMAGNQFLPYQLHLNNNNDYFFVGTATKATVGLTDVAGGVVSTDADAESVTGYTDKYKATAHNNMPPYFAGVVYVLAGYKVNSVMV